MIAMIYRPNITILIMIILLSISAVISQENRSSGIFGSINKDLSISGYVDTYISYDNDKGNPIRQFTVAAPYRDQFRINLAMISLRYSSKHIRGNAALQFGDIP